MNTVRVHIIICLAVVFAELFYLIKVINIFYGNFPFDDGAYLVSATIVLSTIALIIVHLSCFVHKNKKRKE